MAVLCTVVASCSDFLEPSRRHRESLSHLVVDDPGGSLIPTLGGTSGYAWAVNDAGVVVGDSRRPDGTPHAYKWSATEGITDLLSGFFLSRAADISNSGVIVGRAWQSASNPTQLALRLGPGGPEMLPPLETGKSAIALGVNDAGVAVGISHSTAVMWDVQGNAISLGTLPGDLYSEAYDINDSGVIVGVSADDMGQRAIKYTPGIGMEALPNPGEQSWANAINNAGQIVGGVRYANGQHSPVLWDTDGGLPIDLRGTPGSFSQAFAINDDGIVVGEAGGAFVWDAEGGMQMLQGGSANAINNSGMIAGNANAGGFTRAVYWVLGAADSALVLVEPAPGDSLSLRPAFTGGDTTATIRVSVLDGAGNRLINRSITLTLAAVDSSGGHYHTGTPRPAGSLTSSTVNTGQTGTATVTYRSPIIAGEIRLVARSDGARDGLATLNVRVPGLVALVPGSNVDTIRPTNGHPSSNWGTQEFVQAITALADSLAVRADFYRLHSDSLPTGSRVPQVLNVNDMSLVWGGKFDLNEQWTNAGSHAEHRRGLNADVDVRRGSQDDFYHDLVRFFWEDIMGHSLLDERERRNHVHLRF
jgi:probable HAF family extracellular repeat protein